MAKDGNQVPISQPQAIDTRWVPAPDGERPEPGAWTEALPYPCALFDRPQRRMLRSNAAFRLAFAGGAGHDLGLFLRGFDSASTTLNEALGEALRDPDSRRSCEADGFHPQTGRWFRLTLATPPGPYDCWVLSAIDLTERAETLSSQRRMQDQLLFSSRVMSLGEMATTLAHELNQPLATILNYLSAARSLLEGRGPSDADRHRLLVAALGQAHTQAEQAAAVVARIREFVRSREPRREPLILDESFARVLQCLRLDAHRQNVRVEMDIDPTLPRVLVDRIMIEQVLTNLLKNAIEAMEATPVADREVRLIARRALDGRVEVRVSDRGPGLGDGDEAQLFAPFFTTKANGMGVGLSICRSIVEFHEGSLYVERNPERGLSFVFTVPPAP